MIVVTGAAGFIGSNLISKLNAEGYKDIVLSDKFDNVQKNKNLENKQFSQKIDRDSFLSWLDENHTHVQFIFHIGARTDTAEFDTAIFDKLNLNYTKSIWKSCVKYGLPIVYASSAATYGLGEFGYDDNHKVVEKLKPLNPYGVSKNDFDKWALAQTEKPFFWAGMKFFNVYGPNEYHKDRMASVILHAYKQISETGKMKLFRSHNPDFKDGEQLRDFVYVKDVVDVLFFMMTTRKQSGLYNLGTGKARAFVDLTKAVFKALDCPENISFVDTPLDIREKYQYYTQANLTKLRSIGYKKVFYTLEQGCTDYVKNYITSTERYA